MNSRMTRLGLVLVLPALALAVGATARGELSSTNHRLRGAHVSAGGGAAASASYSHSGAVGQSHPVGPSGSSFDLGSLLPGFFPIVAGGSAALDLDADGVAWFLDADADGDGLDDVIETNTGVFTSATDTGSNSLWADTDGDGSLDGIEVALGSDPNDPFSTPNPVPVFGAITAQLFALAFGALGFWALRRQLPHGQRMST